MLPHNLAIESFRTYPSSRNGAWTRLSLVTLPLSRYFLAFGAITRTDRQSYPIIPSPDTGWRCSPFHGETISLCVRISTIFHDCTMSFVFLCAVSISLLPISNNVLCLFLRSLPIKLSLAFFLPRFLPHSSYHVVLRFSQYRHSMSSFDELVTAKLRSIGLSTRSELEWSRAHHVQGRVQTMRDSYHIPKREVWQAWLALQRQIDRCDEDLQVVTTIEDAIRNKMEQEQAEMDAAAREWLHDRRCMDQGLAEAEDEAFAWLRVLFGDS